MKIYNIISKLIAYSTPTLGVVIFASCSDHESFNYGTGDSKPQSKADKWQEERKKQNDEMEKQLRMLQQETNIDNEKLSQEIKLKEEEERVIYKKFEETQNLTKKKSEENKQKINKEHEEKFILIEEKGKEEIEAINKELDLLNQEMARVIVEFETREASIREEQKNVELEIIINFKKQRGLIEQEYAQKQHANQIAEAKEEKNVTAKIIESIKGLSIKERVDAILQSFDEVYVNLVIDSIKTDSLNETQSEKNLMLFRETVREHVVNILTDICIQHSIIPKFYVYSLEKIVYTVKKIEGNEKQVLEFMHRHVGDLIKSYNNDQKSIGIVLYRTKQLYSVLSSEEIIKSSLEKNIYETFYNAYKAFIIKNQEVCLDNVIRNINYKGIEKIDLYLLRNTTRDSIKSCSNPDELNKVSTILYLKLRLEAEIRALGLEELI